MRIQKSDIVLSLAGRDRGGRFVVVDTTEGFAWLADGKGRRIEKPKQKTLRHLRYVCSDGSQTGEKIRNGLAVTNNELKRTLKAVAAQPGGTIKEVC